jgi:tyrosyl-tRNA synthetase
VALDEPPGEMYGKLMSIPDTLIADYFELLTDIPDEELAYIRSSIDKKAANPMEHKLRLARDIVAQFHGNDSAEEAHAEFGRVFRAGEQPEEVAEYGIGFDADVMTIDLGDVLVASAVASSRAEARRLLRQGAVEADGSRVTEARWPVRRGAILRVGKHRFLRIVDSEEKR